MVIELMVWFLNCCVVIELTKKKMQKWPDNLTDENLVSPPIFSFPKPFSHRNEFKSDDEGSYKATGPNFAFCTYKQLNLVTECGLLVEL